MKGDGKYHKNKAKHQEKEEKEKKLVIIMK
jgi:hypothetical protein